MDVEQTLARIKSLEEEINELSGLILDDKLYEPVLPLYHRPDEVPGFAKLLETQRQFGPRFRDYLRVRIAKRYAEERERKETFMVACCLWQRKVKALEANDQHNKTTVHIDRTPSTVVIPPPMTMANGGALGSRGSRRTAASDVVRSEEELNRVLLSLLEQERDNPATRWMATLAVPPVMLEAQPKHLFKDQFIDNNGFVHGDRYKSYVKWNCQTGNSIVHVHDNVVWTESEQRIFIEKFLVYPKNFRKIASFLPFKQTADCVAFYYRTKKTLRLKQLRKGSTNVNTTIEEGKPRVNRRTSGTAGAVGRPPKKSRGVGRPPKSARISDGAESGEAIENEGASGIFNEEDPDRSNLAMSLLSLSTTYGRQE